jgi:hypothetical protein
VGVIKGAWAVMWEVNVASPEAKYKIAYRVCTWRTGEGSTAETRSENIQPGVADAERSHTWFFIVASPAQRVPPPPRPQQPTTNDDSDKYVKKKMMKY